MDLEKEIMKHKTIEELEADIKKLQSMRNVHDQMMYCFTGSMINMTEQQRELYFKCISADMVQSQKKHVIL